MRQQPSAPARAVRRRSFAVTAAVSVVAAALISSVVLAGPPAQAQTDGDAGRPVSSLAPLFDPVGSLAGSGVDLVAATTTHMIVAATPPPPPPPPPSHVCPVPGSEFIDSWGFARSGGRRHKGVDMMAPHGTPVYAPAAGAIRASNSALGGLGFWLEGADGNTYFGSHLQTLTVREGWVEPGTPIGTVGSTGNAGGTPHLHFEVMLGGSGSVNPYPFVLEWCGAEAPTA
jgi:murein DD-endopeptidase MepM/ murein hydrolase activator NlpD